MINWVVRFRNKAFWLALVPAVLLLIQAVAALIGVKLDLTDLQTKLLAVVDAAFVLLTVLGIVTDPTTAGISDSMRAMRYTSPTDSDVMTLADSTRDI